MDRTARKQRPSPAGERAGGFVAEVAEIDATGGALVRRLSGLSALQPCRVAVPGYAPRPGDRVVVLDVGEVSAAIVGVLDAPPPTRIAAGSGASAAIEGEAIVVRDAGGALVATYDGASLRLGAVDGKLVLDAGEIELHARTRVAVTSPELELTARRADLHAEEATLTATEVRTVADQVSHAAGRIEVRVERLIERAGEAYREAELAETRADRVRTVAQGSFEVVAGRASILADDDAVLDGKRVLLG
jgi:hypothetical protein